VGRAAWAAVFACALAGCATRPPAGADWLSGRLQVKVEATAATPSRSVASAFDLRGDGEEGELRLNSPLGTRIATAIWSPGHASLATAEGVRRYADLEALATDALGESLPLRALPAWLRGGPWPGAGSLATETGFEQFGWQVNLSRFSADGLIEAARASPPIVSVRARMEKPE
jgi:outer membrane lipoprotein LolB